MIPFRPMMLYNQHHNATPKDAIHIGRGTPWGNPHAIKNGVTREEACAKFEIETLPKLDLSPLVGMDLECFCVTKPWKLGDSERRRCHGMSIMKEIVRRNYGNELISLREENARLRTWNNDLLGGFKVNCVYCGKQYGPDDGKTPISMATVLQEHIERCPDHPMKFWKDRAVAAEAELAEIESRADDRKGE